MNSFCRWTDDSLNFHFCRSQKEREKIDLRGRVITTMDRELSALRTGRKLSDRQGNENLSVKNLIASIEHQVTQRIEWLSSNMFKIVLTQFLGSIYLAFMEVQQLCKSR